MSSSSQLKREFIKKWAKGLQTYKSSKKEMSFLERKKAIKLSADVAMASTRINTTTTTSWSFALISNAKNDDSNAVLVENILGPESSVINKSSSDQSLMFMCHKRFRSKKSLKKSCGINVEQRPARKKAHRAVLATCIAKRMVKKRTQVLKRLVPGGDSMDEFSLIKETLDYIVALRAQVDVMRSLATATEFLNCKKMDDSTPIGSVAEPTCRPPPPLPPKKT